MKEEFKNSYDRMTVFSTSATVGMLILLIALVIITKSGTAATALISCLYIFVYIFSPTGYTVTDEDITVHRHARPFVIPVKEILSVEESEVNILNGAGNSLMSGGLFGWFGVTRTRELGKFYIYARKQKNYVLLRTREKTYVLTPDEKEKFVSGLNSLLLKNGGPDSPVSPAETNKAV